MALPTVQYAAQPPATDAFLVANWMPALHSLLTAAGWTIEWADSDAIGTGSSSNPAWTKTPANNTEAGTVVYRMPSTDHATRWYARITPAWAGATGRIYVKYIQIGTNHDGTGGLTGGGPALIPTTTTGTTKDYGYAIAASEDGFLVLPRPSSADSSVPIAIVERVRTSDGTILDDVYLGTAWTSWNGALVSATHGVVHNRAPVTLVGLANAGSVSGAPSLESNDASELVVTGPYIPGGDPLFAPPRLAVIASIQDVATSSTHELIIDGASRTYAASPANMNGSYGIWLVATE